MSAAATFKGKQNKNAASAFLDFANFHSGTAEELEDKLYATEPVEAKQALARICEAKLVEIVSALAAARCTSIDRRAFCDLVTEITSAAPTGSEAAAEPIGLSRLVTRLADVKADRWTYLFDRRIAFGTLTILFGPPGMGKSAVVADLVATLSRGGALPDGHRQEPISTLLMTLEDDPSKTLRPRFEIAEADMEKILIWNSAPCLDGKVRPPNIVDHLDLLEQLVREYGTRLLIVDPLPSFLPPKVDMSKDTQGVADALNALADLVRRLDIACVIVAYPPKGSKAKAIDRIFGAVTVAGVIRSALELRDDPDNEGALLLVSVKANIGPACDGLRLRIESGQIDAPDDGQPISVSRVEWGETLPGVTAQSLDDAASERSGERQPSPRTVEAVEFLKAQLAGSYTADSAIPGADLIKKAGNAGISQNALYDARKVAGVRSTPKDFAGPVSWYIPGPEDEQVL